MLLGTSGTLDFEGIRNSRSNDAATVIADSRNLPCVFFNITQLQSTMLRITLHYRSINYRVDYYYTVDNLDIKGGHALIFYSLWHERAR